MLMCTCSCCVLQLSKHLPLWPTADLPCCTAAHLAMCGCRAAAAQAAAAKAKAAPKGRNLALLSFEDEEAGKTLLLFMLVHCIALCSVSRQHSCSALLCCSASHDSFDPVQGGEEVVAAPRRIKAAHDVLQDER